MKFRLSRLALLLALSTLLTAISGVVATYWVAQDEFRDVMDDDLKNQGELLAQVLSASKNSGSGASLSTLLAGYLESIDEDDLWLTVYDLETGQFVSNLQHDLPLQDDSDHDLHVVHNDHDWYGFQRKDDDMVVQILRQGKRFNHVQSEIFEDITTPMLVVGGVNLLLLAVLLALVLWPLSRLTRQLESRDALSLEPMKLNSPTREIDVLQNTLNRLMLGVDATLKRERQFANDLAHELRTPLTTLKLELAGPEPDLDVMKFEVNRVAKVLEQLLTLARLEQGHWQGNFIDIRLDKLCNSEISALGAVLATADIQIDMLLNPVTVRGDSVLLGILLRNLLNNVIHHCPAGTGLELKLVATQDQAILTAIDSGPGVSTEQLEQLNAGFSRMDSRSSGLGMGLAICRRIADVHEAALTFQTRQDNLAGLQVELIFPRQV